MDQNFGFCVGQSLKLRRNTFFVHLSLFFTVNIDLAKPTRLDLSKCELQLFVFQEAPI